MHRKAFQTVLFVLLLCFVNFGFIHTTPPSHQMNLVRQEEPPSIEYKYIVRNILPAESHWWRRGTHRYLVDNSQVQVVLAR